MEKVLQRHLLITDRETLMITFERRVPESERATRAGRVIDDIIDAESRSQKIGHKAAAGVAATVVGASLFSTFFDSSEGET